MPRLSPFQIEKKLKQIDALKKQSPDTLDDDQKAKVASEPKLQEEVRAISDLWLLCCMYANG